MNISQYTLFPLLVTDGICCQYRQGWYVRIRLCCFISPFYCVTYSHFFFYFRITITTKKSGQEKEVVWNHDGEFTDVLDVYLQVSPDGREIQVEASSASTSLDGDDL